MKKVVHIVESFGGGVFTILVDLINSSSMKFETVVLYGKRKETPENFKEYFSENVKFIEVKNFTRSINIKKDIKSVNEIKKIIKELKPNVVHLHSSKAGIIGRIAISSKNIKLLYTPHGFSFLKKDDSKIKRKVYWFIEKIFTFRKCKIVGCSVGEYEEAMKLSKNSICISNGINLDKIQNETEIFIHKELNLEKLKICTSGRIGYQKNPKLFNEIAKAFPNIEFSWIGDGDLIEELTSKNITITGWKSRQEVLEILNKNDIFILPSLWEGLPISLLEAMYMKKICIVSNVIGNKDVIDNTKNGFICEEIDDYIKLINDVLCNKFNIYDLTNNAHKDIIEIYNTHNMSGKYMELYSQNRV